MKKPIVIIESPYAGDVKRNTEYARAALKDSLMRGEAPFASHLLYTQVLDDTVDDERDLGISAGFAYKRAADYSVFYTDLGWTTGMELGLEASKKAGQEIIRRCLGGKWGQSNG